MTTANREQRRARNGTHPEPTPLPVPQPVIVGQLSAQEARTITTRRELATKLRAEAQDKAMAAAHLEASVEEFAAIAYARRGLTNVVGIDNDGNILGLPSESAPQPVAEAND
jgi:hypothetical protein